MSVGEFWDLTPRETYLVFRSAARRLQQARERDLRQAWYTAALMRQKRLPALGRLLQPQDARPLSGDEAKERAKEFEALSRRLGKSDGNRKRTGQRSRPDPGQTRSAR